MGRIKIMPCLDMKEGRVVKGIHFVDLRGAGIEGRDGIEGRRN